MSHELFEDPSFSGDGEEMAEGIAIVGMSGRFPGAANLEQFWSNLAGGVESIRHFSPSELRAAGVSEETLANPSYLPAAALLEEIDHFDADFFGFGPVEAELLDPNHRVFLEQAWQALEDAGYDSERFAGAIGVFAGMGFGEYRARNLLPNRRDVLRRANLLQMRIYNDKDFLASLAAYKMNLRGPSFSVQTACSTSLVAASVACQSLLAYQCDLALVGGVEVSPREKIGYTALEGVFSHDGHCRAFDAEASGTVAGSGAGVMVLKRLDEALAEGDTIRALIRGWAVSNDGALKMNFTAPGIDGQAEAVAMAQAVAGVDPDSISYIEAHGTGTPLGDAVEVAALEQVFREQTKRRGFCALGSVKTNIGHLDAAAGVAGVLKTVLALEHEELPPSLHYRQPNPQIDFANSPFYVVAQNESWPRTAGKPRRAGVSSFAVGGVNAHLVLEEAPPREPSGPGRPWQLLPVSAKTESALETLCDALAESLGRPSAPPLADAAYTLATGRRAFEHRRVVVSRDRQAASELLSGRAPGSLGGRAVQAHSAPSVAFLLPGLGNHHLGMAADTYRHEAVFKAELDRCVEFLEPLLGCDLQQMLYGGDPPAERPAEVDFRRLVRGGEEPADDTGEELIQTRLAQPVLFAVEYALARQWMAWGVRPQALIGYSIGEYVAACLAGVLELEDALTLVARRAELIDRLPAGAMLAVSVSEFELEPLLGEALSIAAVNGTSGCVAAGPEEAIDRLGERLAEEGVPCRRLATTHAFHSQMMQPVVAALREEVGKMRLRPPEIPYLSNVTGDWIRAEEAMDPEYWSRHLCYPVRFADGLSRLLEEERMLLEVGPGQALSAWAQQHPAADRILGAVASLPHALDGQSDLAVLCGALGRLWLAGVEVDWEAFYEGEQRHRVSLPPHPFERRRFWIAPPSGPVDVARPSPSRAPERIPDPARWLWLPTWRETVLPEPRSGGEDTAPVLLFADTLGLGDRLARTLRDSGREVVCVVPGKAFASQDESVFAIRPGEAEDLETLWHHLEEQDREPVEILHLWDFTADELDPEAVDPAFDLGFYTIFHLAQLLGEKGSRERRLWWIANGLADVTGRDPLHPAKAVTHGLCRALPQEYSELHCHVLDLGSARTPGDVLEYAVCAELAAAAPADWVAWREERRWVEELRPQTLPRPSTSEDWIRDGGVYLLTGGLGDIALALAESLARRGARLALVGRTELPPRDAWDALLADDTGDPELAGRLHRIRQLEALGAEVLVLAADVGDQQALACAVRRVRQRFGRIDGAIHAAGVYPGGLLQVKEREQAAAVLAPKVAGTLHLDALLRDTEAEFLLLCSSVTARAGTLGLADHAAANAFLDAWACHGNRRNRRQESTLQVLSVAWDSWLEIGQAARGRGERIPFGAPQDHPLLGHRVVDDEGVSFYAVVESGRCWPLDEHRVAGRSWMPGTAFLDMVRAAAARELGTAGLEMTQVVFASPFALPDGERRTLRTHLRPRPDESFDAEIASQNMDGTWQPHFLTRVQAGAAAAPRCDLAAVEGRTRGQAQRPRSGPLDIGPRWGTLGRELRRGEGEAVSRLELAADFRGDLEDFPLHPALLDAATGVALAFAETQLVPVACDRVVVHGPLQERVVSHGVLRSAEDHTGGSRSSDLTVADIAVTDEDGRVLVEFSGYTVSPLPSAGPQRPASQGTADEPVLGLTPTEGMEVFERLLSRRVRGPRVLISVADLVARLERSGKHRQPPVAASRQTRPRPQIPTPFVAPRNDLETELCALWQELLGLEAVGIHDRFFDIGGDSLMATRLIARLDEDYLVALSLRSLFEAPTVTELAVAVLEAQAAEADDELLAQALAEIEQGG